MSIKSRFCAKCGREAEALADGICPECRLVKERISIPKKIFLKICRKCMAVEWKGVWVKSDFEPGYYFAQEILEKAKIPKDAEIEDLKILKTGEDGKVEVEISLLGKKFVQVFPVAIELRQRLCKDCVSRISEKHDAVVQARAELNAKKFSDDILKLAKKYNSHIISVVPQKSGIDILMLGKEAAHHLASEIRAKFNCRMSESGERVGWDRTRSKPKYRNIILLRQKT